VWRGCWKTSSFLIGEVSVDFEHWKMPTPSLPLELTIDCGHARKSPTADIHDLPNIPAKVAP